MAIDLVQNDRVLISTQRDECKGREIPTAPRSLPRILKREIHDIESIRLRESTLQIPGYSPHSTLINTTTQQRILNGNFQPIFLLSDLLVAGVDRDTAIYFCYLTGIQPGGNLCGRICVSPTGGRSEANRYWKLQYRKIKQEQHDTNDDDSVVRRILQECSPFLFASIPSIIAVGFFRILSRVE